MDNDGRDDMGQDDRQLTATIDARALETTPMAVVVAEADGAFSAANERAEAVLAVLDDEAAEAALTALTQAARDHGTVLHGRIEGRAAGARDTSVFEVTVMPTDGNRVAALCRDVTLDDALRTTLMESRQRYKDLVEISSDFAWEVGEDGAFVFVSPRGALGFVPDELVGRDPGAFLLETTETRDSSPFATRHRVEEVEVWMRRSDGGSACLLASAAPLKDDGGVWRGARGVCVDVTEEREREAALARARNRERVLTYIVRTFRDEMNPERMLDVAAQGIARGLSADGCHILRGAHEEREGERPGRFEAVASFGETGGEDGLRSVGASLGSGADHLEIRLDDFHVLAATTRFQRHVNGAVVLWRSERRAPWSDDDRILIDDIANQIGIANEQLSHHRHILEISRTDPLTGLYNRRAFLQEVDRHFDRLRHAHAPAALIYVDLDNFKAVNDTFGHQAGDDVLVRVRDLLTGHVRPTDLVARLGGDEFAVWLDGADARVAEAKARDMLETCRDSLAELSASEDKPLLMSIGVAVYDPSKPETRDELIQRADEAMYAIKKQGKGSFGMARPPANGRSRGKR